ncbi:UDP-glycosyltransferase 73C11-like [Primulina eburnea]|uniref:UDP-glycosyltransferase 73C11-like n=1 Tax=Primulina eburnea TaxID=1245227 RepID=UPI003C6C52D0
MAGIQPEHLNFLLIPFMAPGHVIPMIDMAKVLARHGVNVTIMLTPLNFNRFSSVVNRAAVSGLPIQLLQIRFPSEEAGLPVGCESADTLPSYQLIHNFFVAIKLLLAIVEEKLEEMNPIPSCVICDKHLPWMAEACKKFEIPRVAFDGMSCFTQLVMHNLYVSKIHESVPETVPFVVPGLPDEIEFTKLQLPGLFNPGTSDFFEFREQVRLTESQAYGVVVNSFEELENGYVDEFKKIRGGKVWSIGPLSLSIDDNLDRAERGNQASIDAAQCLKWFDSRRPGSVIYACLGSLARLSAPQFLELALGLEASNHPFILVMNAGSESKEIEKWISEEGFEERTRERCLLIRGWAPQVLILSHPAVGGFLTHCGWNSTLESVCAGLPMVTYPLFGEQFLNEKLVVQVLKIGVGVGARVAIHLGEQEKPEAKVTRDRIQAAVEMVMDQGEEGCERRRMAQELGKMAKRSVKDGGSSCLNIKLLIEDIAKLAKQKKSV